MRWRLVPVAALLVVLTGCADAAAEPVALDAAPDGATPAVVLQVVAVGDSITEMDSPDFDDGAIGQGSWAWWAAGRGVDVRGGWAHGGATSEDMLDGVTTTGPLDGDTLVLMAGNNDIDLAVPTQQVLENLVEIAAAAGVPRVVLSAVAPEDGLGAETLALDADLAQLAADQGWQYVDPMTEIRDDDGDYRDGATLDGVHPTEEAAAKIGVALHEALLHPAAVVPAEQTG